MTTHSTFADTHSDPRTTPAHGRVLFLSLLLTFGVIGWEHAYHTVFLGVAAEHSGAAHLGHVLRDALLAFPIAIVAVVAGLHLGRRYGLSVRAALISGTFGLLLVPSVRLHALVDGAAQGGHAHHHEHGGGLEGATGFSGILLHGLRDAAVAELAALPLALVGLLLLERVGRGRRPSTWGRPAAVAATAALALFAFTGIGLAGDSAATQTRGAVEHTFELTDNPGNWFDTGTSIAGTRSLVVARPGDTIRFKVGAETNTVHTASSLLYPTGAAHMPFDQPHAYDGVEKVRVTTPGLYVFLCKLHPFMLGGVIADDPATQGLDLGKTITLVSGATVPTASDLAFRLVRSFFNITSTQNYQVHTKTGSMWDPVYPAVPVLAHDKNGAPVLIPDLNAAFQSYFHEPIAQPAAIPPTGKGIGEVWINTEYEQTAAKTKPGTATAVRTADWAVTRKVALPSVNIEQPAQHVDRSLAVGHLRDAVVRRQADRLRPQDGGPAAECHCR